MAHDLLSPLYGTADGRCIRHGGQRGSRGSLLLDSRRRSFEDVDEDVETFGDVSEEILDERDNVPVHEQLPFGVLHAVVGRTACRVAVRGGCYC